MRLYNIVFLAVVLSFSMMSCGNLNGKSDTHHDIPMKNTIDTVKVDYKVAAIKESTKETSPAFIKKRLEELIGHYLKSVFIKKNLKYPPCYLLLRVFKLEKECEIWVKEAKNDSIYLVLTLPICAVDDEPGPKLKQGDGKTPEGFYNCSELYGSNLWFMWIRLNPDEIENSGKCNVGSSFRLWLDYPNLNDVGRTEKYIGLKKDPGGAICVHGNCVTAGCISYQNINFLPVFLLAKYHDQQKNGPLQIHVFPFRFTEKLKNEYIAKNRYIPKDDLLKFWNNLEEGYRFVNEKRKPLNFNISKSRYSFR